MLVLTRKVGQTIIIGNKLITITYLGGGESQIRVGIDAPKELSVHREEIYYKIQQEKEMGIVGNYSGRERDVSNKVLEGE